MTDVILPEADRRSYERFRLAPAVRAGGLVLLSGQLSPDESGKVTESPLEEFRNDWRAVGRVLEAAALGYGDIIEYTTFDVGLQEHLGDFMRARDEFLGEPWPNWTVIGVSELTVAGARVEAKATALASLTG